MYSAEYILRTVDGLVRRYGTRDPYELCRALHIVIYKKDLHRKLKGFFFCCARQKSIVIDSNVNEILGRILTAHELGHAVLHREAAMMHGFQELEMLEGSAKPMEYEANLFAAELLLEDAPVLEHLQRETFFGTARAMNVPAALLDFKFTALRAKGYGFGTAVTGMGVGRPDFLKNDCGAYEGDPQEG